MISTQLPTGAVELRCVADSHDARDIRAAVKDRILKHPHWPIPDATHDDADPMSRALAEICRVYLEEFGG